MLGGKFFRVFPRKEICNCLIISVKEVESSVSWTCVNREREKLANGEKCSHLPSHFCCLSLLGDETWKQSHRVCLQTLPRSVPLLTQSKTQSLALVSESLRVPYMHTHTRVPPFWPHVPPLAYALCCSPPFSWPHLAYSLLPQAFILPSSLWTAVPKMAAWLAPLTPSGLRVGTIFPEGHTTHYIKHTHTLTARLCHHALLSLFFIAFLYYFGLSPPLECNRHTSRVCSIQCLPPEPTTAPGMHSTLWTFVQWIHVAWTRTALTLPYTEKTQHSKVCIQKNELHRREIIHTIIEEIIKEHVFLVHFKWDSVCTDLMHVGSSGRFALCFQKESGVFLLCEVVTLLNWTVGVVIRKRFTHSPRMRYKFVDIHRTWIWHISSVVVHVSQL